MPILESIIGPLVSIIDKVIPDKEARDRAKIELIKLEGSQELEGLQARLSAILAEAESPSCTTGRSPVASILRTAMSVISSDPTTLAAYSVPSSSFTVIFAASFTT